MQGENILRFLSGHLLPQIPLRAIYRIISNDDIISKGGYTMVTLLVRDLDRELHQRLKILAVREGKSLKQLAQDALREYVDRHEQEQRDAR
jgi:hypothetical protein